MKPKKERKKGEDPGVLIGGWSAGIAGVGKGIEVVVEVVIGKEIEGTGIGKERKKMREVEEGTGTMTRKEAMTGKRRESDQGSDPRNGEVGVRWKRKNIKKTRMIDGIEMTKKIPRKRKGTVEAEAEKGSTEVGVEVGTRGNGVEAGAERSQVSIRVKARRSQISEAEVAVKEELTVSKSQEKGNVAPAKINLESVVEAKNVPTSGITVIVRTSLTNMIVRGAKV